MIILAIDTASDRLLGGIASGEKVLSEHTGPPDRSHSEKIISVIDGLVRDANLRSSQIDAIAVTTGPGSFTGLRVGIATVLGLAQAWNKKIYGIRSTAMARLFFNGRSGSPVVVTHCRGDEFYVSVSGDSIEIINVETIIGKLKEKQFAGSGIQLLLQAASKHGVKLQAADPATWSGGDLAATISKNIDRLELLDPINLNVNYVLKSQPEQKREAAQQEITIADLTYSDLPGVMAIEKEAFSDPWREENFVADIENPHIITLAARHGQDCVGYLSCIAMDDYGYIANIAVDAEYRAKGVARALMEELRLRLKSRGINEVALDVRVSNSRAIGFYQKYGFTVITRRKGFYTTPPEDSFTMLKNWDN